MDPGTAILIASAISAAAKGTGDYFANKKAKKSGELRAKETKRETLAGLLNDAYQGSGELAGQYLTSRGRLGKRNAQNMQNTSDLVRGALNI